jgi:hypothetical protein
MRRIRAIGVVIALIGLAGAARAQYYPAPQHYYNPYNPYPYAPPGYGYYPNPPAAAPPREPVTYGPLLPTEEDAAPAANPVVIPKAKPILPAAPIEKKVLPAQVTSQEPPGAGDSQVQDPIDATGIEEPMPVYPGRAIGRRPVNYTIPEVLGSFPFTAPATPSRFYFKSDYLLWRMRNGPPRYPLVTTDTNPTAPNSGAINSPTATPLFGNDGLHYGTFNGIRGTIGVWLDADQRFGIEGTGFVNETRSIRFFTSSDAAGNPALYLPAYNVLLSQERGLIVSDPTIPLAGNVAIDAALQLWGAEINGIYTLARTDRFNVEMLAGFRYLDLLETLNLQNTTSGFGFSAYLTDHFQTRNQFYGAQIGTRANWTHNRWNAGLSAKIALGPNHQVSEIRGENFVVGIAPPQAGGFLTQPTNISRSNQNAFSAVPQFGATLGFNVTPRFTVFAAYDFLLWTYVARAGDQIDRTVNLSQSTQFGQGALFGAVRPEAVFHHADFWAQGVSFGVQYRY